MFFSRKCTHCGAMIGKGEGLKEEVDVYGLVGKHARHFCSEECLEKHRKITSARKATRRPNVCMSCLK